MSAFRILFMVVLCTLGSAAYADAYSAAQSDEPPKPSENRLSLPPAGYMKACVDLISKGHHAEARRRLEPVVADHPGWGRAQFYLALTYHKEYRYQRARVLFAKSIELDPSYHPTRIFYGWCLYYLGELEDARKMFEAFLVVRPDYADAIFALGLIDFDLDELDSAARRFQRAEELGKADNDTKMQSKALARLGDVWVRRGGLDEARAAFERSIELNRDNYETYYKLSRVLDRLGDTEGAARMRTAHETIRERIRPSQPQGERRPGE
jgi:tetratricopeptide (TPR) repeat protein